MTQDDGWFEWFLERLVLGIVAIGLIVTIPVWLPLLAIGSGVVWVLKKIQE